MIQDQPTSALNNDQEQQRARVGISPMEGNVAVPSLRRELPIDGSVTHSHKRHPFASNKVHTTKYYWWNLLPKGLILQFMRGANCYFLFETTLTTISILSPLNPFFAIVPLLVVLLISLIREGIEDYRRYRNDQLQNNMEVMRMSRKSFEKVIWRNLHCGNFVLIHNNEIIPADLLIIFSSTEHGIAYVETSNLDGERNLKPKTTLECVQKLYEAQGTVAQQYVKGQLRYDQPNNRVHHFSGTFTVEDETLNMAARELQPPERRVNVALENQKLIVNNDNILLRGTILRNTEWVIGCVIYAGRETKIAMNSGEVRQKQSHVEKMMNYVILFLFVLQSLICLLLAVLASSNYANDILQYNSNGSNAFYLYASDQSQYTPGTFGVIQYFSFFILLSSIIPISMIVTLETAKLVQTVMIESDQGMRIPGGESMRVLNTQIHEELGKVEYIFTDKTGTLTCNEMEFRGCCIGTTLYSQDTLMTRATELSPQLIHLADEFYPKNEINLDKNSPNSANLDLALQMQDSVRPLNENNNNINGNQQEAVQVSTAATDLIHFFLCICTCNDVIRNISVGNEKQSGASFQGSSLDEVCLVEAMAAQGVELLGRTKKHISINFYGERILILDTYLKIDFTSDRKRMSVVVRQHNTPNYTLYCKGADSFILKALSPTLNDREIMKGVEDSLMFYSKAGLRTLCLARKELPAALFEQWLDEYQTLKMLQATSDQEDALVQRHCEQQLAQLYDHLENDLQLIGVTAVEDKLQDGVRECLSEFLQAGIKVWMLTGDKLETAENIGYLCDLIDVQTKITRLTIENSSKTARRLDKLARKIDNFEEQLGIKGKKKGAGRRRASVRSIEEFKAEGIDLVEAISAQQGGNVGHGAKKGPSHPHPHPHHQKGVINHGGEGKDNKHQKNVVDSHSAMEIQRIYKESSPHNERGLVQTQKLSPPKKASAVVPAPQPKIRGNTFLFANRNNNNNGQGTPQQNALRTAQKNQQQFGSQASNVNFINLELRAFPAQDQLSANESRSHISQNIVSRAVIQEFKRVSKIYTKMALIVEGDSLAHILCDPESTSKFLNLVDRCATVICCRMTPQQKADMVVSVKRQLRKFTLAIGDGGNDVKMIQQADIGVGILGREGNQAALASDYYFTQMRFLKRLLFLHGRWSLQRTSYFINNFLWKNFLIFVGQIFFAIYSDYSAQTFYSDGNLLVYNSGVNSVIPFYYAAFEVDLDPNDPRFTEHLPALYKEQRKRDLFSIKKFLQWTITAIFLAAAFFFSTLFTFGYATLKDAGQTTDIWAFSQCNYLQTLTVTWMVNFVDTRRWNAWTFICYFPLGIFIYFPFFVLLFNEYFVTPQQYEILDMVGNWPFWLNLLLLLLFTFFLYYAYTAWQRIFKPTLLDKILQGKSSNKLLSSWQASAQAASKILDRPAPILTKRKDNQQQDRNENAARSTAVRGEIEAVYKEQPGEEVDRKEELQEQNFLPIDSYVQEKTAAQDESSKKEQNQLSLQKEKGIVEYSVANAVASAAVPKPLPEEVEEAESLQVPVFDDFYEFEEGTVKKIAKNRYHQHKVDLK